MDGKTRTSQSDLASDVDMDFCDGSLPRANNPLEILDETEDMVPSLPRKDISKNSDTLRIPRTKPVDSHLKHEEVDSVVPSQTMSTRQAGDFSLFAGPRFSSDSVYTTFIAEPLDKRVISGSSGYFSAGSDFLSENSGYELSQEFDSLNIKERASQNCVTTTSFTSCSQPRNETEFQVAEEYLEAVEEIYQQDSDGDTHLHTAIITLQSNIAISFINLAPDQKWLDIPNALLQTPLHLAVLTKQIVVIRRLMTGGANLTCQDIKGNTPLHLACMEATAESIEILLQPLNYEETEQNRYDMAFQAIPQDFEIKNYNGQTCLHVSAEIGYKDIVEILLRKGANINSQDGKSGRCILHYAVERGNKALLTFLLQQRGINVSATTYGDQTAIQLAYGRNMHEFVKTLHECGATISEEEDM